MHLLGRAITVDVNKGTPKAQRVLDIPVWDFDDQGSIPLKKPVDVGPGRHDHRHLHPRPGAARPACPAFEGTTDRYVAWGEGTTDEMCLGIVLMTPR